MKEEERRGTSREPRAPPTDRWGNFLEHCLYWQAQFADPWTVECPPTARHIFCLALINTICLMKVGRPFVESAVLLPPEVHDLIVRYVDSRRPRSEGQRDLWACSLLSKAWYSTTIKYLYRSPRLTVRNFDLFSRTLCPPVNSRIRTVGLEEFVVNLDMGGLAYESTRSLTARLLRRTRKSLESFVAPSVSFS